MQPLSKRKRNTLLTSLVIIFLIGAPLIIFYSTGYRLGDALSLVQTGGIFIHSDLAGTSIYIDNEFVEDNGLILKNTLIQDLRPNRNYEIRIEKDGYQTWKKELSVFPNLVTEGRILMLPKDIKFREIGRYLDSEAVTKVKNPEYASVEELFSESNLDQFEIVVSTTTAKTIGGQKKVTVATSTEFSIPDFIEELEIEGLEQKKILREKQRVVTWLERGNVEVRWSGQEDSVPFFFCQEGCLESINVSLEKDILYYDFLPARNDVLIVLNNDGIFAMEIDNRSTPNVQPILIGDKLNFRVRDNNTIFIRDGDMFKEVIL